MLAQTNTLATNQDGTIFEFDSSWALRTEPLNTNSNRIIRHGPIPGIRLSPAIFRRNHSGRLHQPHLHRLLQVANTLSCNTSQSRWPATGHHRK